MKRVLLSIAALIVAGLTIVSCGKGSGSSSTQNKASGLPFRAFVANALASTGGGGGSPVLNIVNAAQDVLSPSVISLSSSPQPQFMALSPNLKYTMVFGFSNNSISVVDNTTESISSNGGGAITLPGFTESMFVANDNATGYAAVPTASIVGQPQGALVVINLTGGITSVIPVPAARFIVPYNNGNQILVFSDDSDTVTVISTALIGTNSDPRSYVTGFDRPVWAIISSDNTTAYIFDCGPECGGTKAGITLLDLGTLTAGPTTAVSAATYGLLQGNTLYVAGTPPNTPCGSGTAATSCGKLSIINTGSMAVTRTAVITDGYHNRMQIGAVGQLFIGSHSCTNVNSGNEVRGCLSIFNTTDATVVVPPQNGDATGIQPISGRTIVYVCQGGGFQIYDTTTDQLLVQDVPRPLDIVGQSWDVKLVDPPTSNVNNPIP